MEYFSTSFNPSGNRFIGTCGAAATMPRKLSYSYESVASVVQWIVGTSSSSSSSLNNNDSIEFVTVSRDGTQRRLNFAADGASSNVTLFDSVEAYTRPLLATGTPMEPIIPPTQTSLTSHSVPTPDGGHLFVSQGQELTQQSLLGENVTSNDLQSIVAPLLDGHITYSSVNRLWAIFNRQTGSRYIHGILGDDQEGHELHILKWNKERNLVEIETSVLLPGDDLVFEQLAPMWADINEDGIDDVLTTTSTTGKGSQLVAYLLNKNEATGGFYVASTASSPFIGTGNRWLHQLAVGPLGPNGETEIVEVRTPHIGGHVRYYRLQENGNDSALHSLVLVAETSLYSTHDIGSRNIDKATVADFNGDGIPELVVPDQQSSFLYGLQRRSDGDVGEVWKVPLGRQRLSSNIGVSCNKNAESERMEILIGLESRELLRISFTADDLSIPNQPSPSASSMVSTGFLACLMLWLWRHVC